VIIAPWVGVNGNIDPTTYDARPGVVSYYIRQNVFLDGAWRTVIMARVNWFQEQPRTVDLSTRLWGIIVLRCIVLA